MEDKLYFYKSKLIRVIDGDTIVAMVDLGFYTWKEVTIRLSGIDTPEVRTKDILEKEQGIAATNRLIELLNMTEGTFYLESRELDSFGRSIGTIYIDGLVESINQTLINEGYAEVYNK